MTDRAQRKHRFERALFAPLIALCALGCHGLTPLNEISVRDQRLAFSGRFAPQPAGDVRFAWAGSRIDVRFSGKSLVMRMTDTPVDDDLRETDWFDIRIDGGEPRGLRMQEGEHVYTLAQGLGAGTHQVAIVKRTEPEVGTATLHGFLLDPGEQLAPAPSKERQIELIGDSITTGFGNLADGPECKQEAALENVEEAYGAVAAHELDAGYTAIAWSGKGLLRNNDQTETQTLPELYDSALPVEQSMARTDLALAPAVVAPADAVVINIGTNDFWSAMPDHARFVSGYRALIARVRARHPGAWLVLILGPMLADDFPQPDARQTMRAWLTEVRDGLRSAGDERVELLEFWFDPKEGVGCDQHPNRITHARMGAELAALLRARLSW